MSKKILLVEDEALIAMSEAKMLEKHGYEVLTVYNGEKAIEAVDSDSDISLVLMDIDLGKGMDGTEAAERILVKHDLPIAFLSSHTETEVVEKTEGITSYGYIVKNSGETVLLASIRMAFRLFEAKQQVKEREDALIDEKERLKEYIERIQERKRIDKIRNKHLLELYKKLDFSQYDLLDYVLNASLEITDSPFAFVGLLNEDESVMSIHRWSTEVMESCSITEKSLEFPIEKAGIWGDAVRERQPIIINDYETDTEPTKQGTPAGHVEIKRFLCVPIFDENRIVAVGAVANKEKPYDIADVDSIAFLYDKMWSILKQQQADLKLQESEKKFRTIFEDSPLGIFRSTPEGKFLEVNQALAEMLGYSSTEAVLENIYDIAEQIYVSTEKRNPIVETQLSANNVRRYVNRYRKADGSIFIANLYLKSIRDMDDNVLYLEGIVEDITERRQVEEKLRLKSSFIERIAKVSPDLFIIYNKDGEYLEIITANKDNLFLKREELLGSKIPEVLPETAASLIMQGIDGALSTNSLKVVEYELEIENKSLYFEARIIPLEEDKVLAQIIDITEKKRAEEALRVSEKKNSAVLHALPDLMFIQDSAGTYLDYYASNKDYLYVQPERFIGQKMQDILPQEVYEDLFPLLEKTLSTKEVQTGEYELTVSGEKRTFEARFSPYDADKALSIRRDITERKEIENKLRKKEAMYHTLMENSIDAVYLLRYTGKILQVNHTACEMLGYSREELLQLTIDDVDPNYPSRHFIEFWNDKPEGATVLFETIHRHKDGKEIPVEVNGTFFMLDNQKSLFGVSRDITERKQAEELLKKRNARLHKINQYSIELSFLRYDDLYPYIVKKLKEIFKISIAWVTEYDEKTSHMVTKFTTLSEKDNSWVMKNLGDKVIGHRAHVNEEHYKMMKNVQVDKLQSLHEVSFGAIPKTIAKTIQKELNLDWFMPVAFMDKDEVKGAAVIAGKPGEEAPDREEILAFAGITGEVIRRKRAEEKLAAKKELLENITANMFDLVALTDINGTYKFVSKSHSGLGYDITHLLGTKVFAYVHPEDITRVETSFAKTIQSNETEGKEDFRYHCADGSYIWVETVGRKLLGENGEIKELLFSSRDITERKRDEERLQKIIDNSPLYINEIDVSGHYILVNESTCRLLGTTKEELLGKHFEEVLPSETASVFKERVNLVSETGEQMSVDDTLHIDRQERIFRTVLFPIYRHDESLPSIIGMGYEITEELRLLREKDFLMQEINHRVKNNLNMVSSLISLKDSETEIDLSDIQHQIEAISLIHEKLYKTENVTEINCRDYIDDLLNSIFTSFTPQHVRVEKDIEDIFVSTKTAISIGLIVNEIATNAIKHGFTDKEEAVFSVNMKENRENGQYELTLSNTGKPFAEDIDIESTDTIGLRLINALVAQIEGTIEMQKKPNPIFTIRFPGPNV